MQIYKITNLVNGKIYVGKQVKNNPNYMGSGFLIKNAIKKYGIDNFKKDILEDNIDNLEILNIREIYWISLLDSTNVGYNIMAGGTGGDTLTNHPRKEDIIKLRSLANTGQKRSDAQKENMSNSQKNYQNNLSPLEKSDRGKKIAESRKERIYNNGLTEKEIERNKKAGERLIKIAQSKDFREKQSIRMKEQQTGKIFSDEHKKNIGIASKGRISVHRKKVQIENIIYDALGIASTELNIPMSTLKHRLNSVSDKFKEWNWLND